MKIALIILAAAMPLFTLSCGPTPTKKVYNVKVQQPTATKTYYTTPQKVGGGGTRYVGSSDTAAGFRAAQ